MMMALRSPSAAPSAPAPRQQQRLAIAGRSRAVACPRRPAAAAASTTTATTTTATTTTTALDEAERELLQLSSDVNDDKAAAPSPPPPAPIQQQPQPSSPLAAPVVFAALAADSAKSLQAASTDLHKTLIRAVLSGCYIAFGGLVAVSVVGASPVIAASGAAGLARLVFALVFPVGLLLNLSHGGELFTGQTMRATLAVMGGKGSIAQLAQNWAVSFCGNFAGALAVLGLVLASGLFTPGSSPSTFASSIATTKLSLPFTEALCRAVLANWLVCLAVWQASAAKTPADRFFAIWPPIAGFVAAGLEHSVANMFLVPLGLAACGALDWASFGGFLASNLLPVTLGNALAGAVVVGGLSHAVYGGGGVKKEA